MGSTKMSATITKTTMLAYQNLARANRRFISTGRYVIENHEHLSINGETANRLNAMLTRDRFSLATPEDWPGRWADGYSPERLSSFDEWVRSTSFEALSRTATPIALAEAVHAKLVELHPFDRQDETGGNGRTARMMADLVMIKHGLPPLHYDSVARYFAQGSPLWLSLSEPQKTPEIRLEYFRAAHERSMRLLDGFRRMREAALVDPASGSL